MEPLAVYSASDGRGRLLIATPDHARCLYTRERRQRAPGARPALRRSERHEGAAAISAAESITAELQGATTKYGCKYGRQRWGLSVLGPGISRHVATKFRRANTALVAMKS